MFSYNNKKIKALSINTFFNKLLIQFLCREKNFFTRRKIDSCSILLQETLLKVYGFRSLRTLIFFHCLFIVSSFRLRNLRLNMLFFFFKSVDLL